MSATNKSVKQISMVGADGGISNFDDVTLIDTDLHAKVITWDSMNTIN